MSAGTDWDPQPIPPVLKSAVFCEEGKTTAWNTRDREK